MEFYDIHEQTPYSITVSRPASLEDLSDLFISREELEELTNGALHHIGDAKQTIWLNVVIKAEVKKLTEELEASGKRTIPINNPELLEILRGRYLSDFTPAPCKYGRYGDRICYAHRYRRVKKRATLGDVRNMWIAHIPSAFREKYGCRPPHIPTYDRSVTLFKAFKKIVGWRRICASIHDKSTVKFFRQIWDNPEEFIR